MKLLAILLIFTATTISAQAGFFDNMLKKSGSGMQKKIVIQSSSSPAITSRNPRLKFEIRPDLESIYRISSDNKYIYFVSPSDKTGASVVRTYDLGTGNLVYELKNDPEIKGYLISHDRKYIFGIIKVSNDSSSIKVFNGANGSLIKKFQIPFWPYLNIDRIYNTDDNNDRSGYQISNDLKYIAYGGKVFSTTENKIVYNSWYSDSIFILLLGSNMVVGYDNNSKKLNVVNLDENNKIVSSINSCNSGDVDYILSYDEMYLINHCKISSLTDIGISENVVIFKIPSGEAIYSKSSQGLRGHGYWDDFEDLGLNDDSSRLLTINSNKSTYLNHNFFQMIDLMGEKKKMASMWDSNFFVSSNLNYNLNSGSDGTPDTYLYKTDLNTGDLQPVFKLKITFSAATFSLDEKLLFLFQPGQNGHISILSTLDGKLIGSLPLQNDNTIYQNDVLMKIKLINESLFLVDFRNKYSDYVQVLSIYSH